MTALPACVSIGMHCVTHSESHCLACTGVHVDWHGQMYVHCLALGYLPGRGTSYAKMQNRLVKALPASKLAVSHSTTLKEPYHTQTLSMHSIVLATSTTYHKSARMHTQTSDSNDGLLPQSLQLSTAHVRAGCGRPQLSISNVRSAVQRRPSPGVECIPTKGVAYGGFQLGVVAQEHILEGRGLNVVYALLGVRLGVECLLRTCMHQFLSTTRGHKATRDFVERWDQGMQTGCMRA